MGITGQITGYPMTGQITGSIIKSPVSGGITCPFLAAYYQSSDYLLGLQIAGKGTAEATHTSTLSYPDADGIYRDFTTDAPAWSGGRAVRVLDHGTDLTALGTTPPTITEVSPGEWKVDFPAGATGLTASRVEGEYFNTSPLGSLFDNIGRVTLMLSRVLTGSESIVIRPALNTNCGVLIIDSSCDFTSSYNILSSSRTAGTITNHNSYFVIYIAGVLTADLTIWVKDWQFEDSTNHTDKVTPSEYVKDDSAAVTVEFATENGNSVDADGIVTEGIGDLLDPHPLLCANPAATNSQKYSNDQTNAEWTVVNGSVLQDATGIKGVANTACTLTASAANCTCIGNAITASNDTQATAWILKRKTGSGTVELTVDNGSTWQSVTLTTDFKRFAVDQASVTNPQIGIRIVTSGDEVIIGNAEAYLSAAKEECLNSSAITTSGAAVSIDALVPEYSSDNLNNDAMLFSCRIRPDVAGMLVGTFLGYGMGPELVANGDFNSSSGWGTGANWSIANGLATCDGLQTGSAYLNRAITTTVDNKYTGILSIKSCSAGSIDYFIGDSANDRSPWYSTAGEYIFDFTAGPNTTPLYIRGDVDFVGALYRISIRERDADTYPNFVLVDMDNNQISVAGTAGSVNKIAFVIHKAEGKMWIYNGDTEDSDEGTYSGTLFTGTTFKIQGLTGIYDIQTCKDGSYEELKARAIENLLCILTDDEGNYLVDDDGNVLTC